jgi:hypothetical protein
MAAPRHHRHRHGTEGEKRSQIKSRRSDPWYVPKILFLPSAIGVVGARDLITPLPAGRLLLFSVLPFPPDQENAECQREQHDERDEGWSTV